MDKYRLVVVVFNTVLIFSLLLISGQVKSEIATLYPTLLSSFASIPEDFPRQCLNRNLNTYQEIANKCLEDICGPASLNEKDLLTKETLKDKIKPEYIKSIDDKKEEIIEIIDERNQRMLENIDDTMETLSKLPSGISEVDPLEIIKSFIQIKNSHGVNRIELSPVLYESGILTKIEFDQVQEKLKQNKNYSSFFSALYSSNPDGSEISRHDKRTIKNKCIYLKDFNFDCQGGSSLKIKYQDKLENPSNYNGDFNFYARDSYELKKRKNTQDLIRNPEMIQSRIMKMKQGVDLLSDQTLIDRINQFAQNPSTISGVDEYLILEEKFFSNILPLPDDEIDLNLLQVPEVSDAIDRIQQKLDPTSIIETLKTRKAQVQALDLEEQLEDLKLDLLMGNQQAWKNKNFPDFKDNISSYKQEFLDKIKPTISLKSFEVIEDNIDDIDIQYATPEFDWFGLKLSSWKEEKLPDTILAVDLFYQQGSNSIEQTLARIKDPIYSSIVPFNIATLYHHLNSPNILGIQSLFTKSVTDSYSYQDKKLSASSFTCSNHKDSKGIFFHELGHFLSDTFNTQKEFISRSSENDFTEARSCVSSQYKKPQIAPIHGEDSPFLHEGDHIYTEEDFADFISSFMQKGEPGSTFCSILTYSRDLDGNLFYSDDNFVMNVSHTDPHSTSLKRILFDILQRGNRVPTSCQKIMQQHLADFDFSGCVSE